MVRVGCQIRDRVYLDTTILLFIITTITTTILSTITVTITTTFFTITVIATTLSTYQKMKVGSFLVWLASTSLVPLFWVTVTSMNLGMLRAKERTVTGMM